MICCLHLKYMLFTSQTASCHSWTWQYSISIKSTRDNGFRGSLTQWSSIFQSPHYDWLSTWQISKEYNWRLLDLLEIDCLLDMVQMTVWCHFSLCILMLICIRLDQNLAFNVIFVTLQHPIVQHHNLMVPCSRLLSTMCYLQPSSYLPLPTFSFRLSSQLNEQTFFPSFL